MHLHLLHGILHFSSLLKSLKYICINSGIAYTSMTTSTNSRLIRRNDSSLPWKSSEIFFWICPRVPGRDFDALTSEEDTISFLRDLGHTGVINSLNDVVIDQMHQPWRTFAAIINISLSGKTSSLDKLRLSRA
ncbi:hypothetical protein Tco_1448249 [Tanacetum coccineum]